MSARADHPPVRDPQVYLTCACCVRRELVRALTAFRQGRPGTAKLIILKLFGEMDAEIEAAVAADRGELQ